MLRPEQKAPLARCLAAVALALGSCSGCAPESLPETYSIGPGFTPVQADEIRVSHAKWCDAVGYCPGELSWPAGELRWLVDFDPEAYPSETKDSFLCLDGHEVHVNGRHSRAHEHWAQARAFTHELGHLRFGGHLPRGLMAVVPEHAKVDGDAIAAWHRNHESED